VLSVEVLVDAAKATTGLDNASSRVDKFAGAMSKLALPATIALGGLVAFGKQAVDSASQVEQAMGAVDSVFKENSSQVKAWADEAATAVGLSKSEYGSLASVIGAQLTNLGVPFDQVAGNTNDLVSLGADLAATFGGSTADAVDALSAALRGEADPAERLGLNLSQTAVNARLAEKGMDGLSGQALTAAKAQTVMELATEQSGGALGQFARESDTAAGSAQIAAAQFENAKASLGEALLPVVVQVTTALSGLASWVQQNSTLVLTFAGIIGGLATAVLAVNAAFKLYNAATMAFSAAQKVATAIQWAWNAAMNANPVMLVVTAIGLLVAGIVLLWQKNEGFRNFVTAAWEGIKTVALAVWDAIKAAVMAVINWIVNAVNNAKTVAVVAFNVMRQAATNVWNGIKSVIQGVVNWIQTAINNVSNVVSQVWNTIKNTTTTVWNGIKSAAVTALNAMLAPIRAVQSAFDAVVNAVKSVINWIKNIKFPEPPGWLKSIGGGISNLFSASAAPSVSRAGSAPSPFGIVAGGSSPTLRAATGLRGPSPLFGSAGGVTINVNGGLDSADAIARRVRDVLRGRDRRTGPVVVGRVVPT
jgi:hypothetical protein